MSKIKKLTALLAAALIGFSSISAVLAEPTEAPAETAEAATEITSDDIIMENPELNAPNTDKAGAALLMDVNSGRIIYGKNIDKKMYPASTTKMMTGILALESGKMGDTTTATYEALQSITLEDSHMGILIGEELSMTDLLNGMLVYSANDASNVIAVHIGGSMQNFVDMMNMKAQELGLTGTHFVNACGVHDDDHYTTARDLAILAKYCMENETFREIVKKTTYHIAPTNKYRMDRYLPTTNLFLSTARSAHHVYAPCTGIKTGTTEKAGHCLVSSAEYNGMSLISVVLNCADLDVNENAYSYTISKSLFDFAFNNYETGVLASPGSIVADSKVTDAKDKKRVTLTVDADVNALIPAGIDVSKDMEVIVELPEGGLNAPIAKGDVLGQVSYRFNDTEIGRSNLVAANDVELDKLLYFFKHYVLNPLILIPVVLIIIIAMIARSRKLRRERKRKIQQIRQRREANERAAAGDKMVRNSERNRTTSKGSNSRYYDDRTNK